MRLVAAAVGLSAIALAVAGFTGVTLLRGYLMRQVDQQLRIGVGAGQRFSGSQASPALVTPLPRPANNQRLHELPNPLLFLVLDKRGKTQQRAGGLPVGSSTPDLPGLTLAAVRNTAGKPFTVRSTDGSTEFRVRAVPLTDGAGSVAVAVSLHPVDEAVGRLRTITLISSGAVLAALVAVAVGAVRLGLRPLRSVERTAGRIAGGDLSHRVPVGPPGTEIGRLSDAVNDMLTQIEASFIGQSRSEETLRQFVADASHELRTPLTTVRGYAELVRRGALPDASARDHALRRIEAEATRMGRLVDDLLLLAYLDQHRPLNVTRVDLAQLVDDAVADARAREPQRPIELVPPDGAVTVDADADRLRQVLGNVLGNALTHTPPGTPVRVVLEDAGTTVRLAVTDAGPGLPPGLTERVFERFYRVDKGRSRASGGSGLGLAIVAAVVQASGGTVSCASEPGAGLTVAIELPAAAPPHPARGSQLAAS